jgi:hypothetical protein
MMEIILQYAIFHIKLLSGVRNNQDSETSLTMYAGTQCETRLFTNLDLTHNMNSKHTYIFKKKSNIFITLENNVSFLKIL